MRGGGWESLGQRVGALSLQVTPVLPQVSLRDSATSSCILVCCQRMGWDGAESLVLGWENNSVGKVLVVKV